MKIINHKVASENNNDNLVNEVLVKDHIHFEKKSCPNLVSEVVAKHDILDDWMVKLLECPICLNVPRDLPIPACSAGHIICKKCKSTVTTCPTCRRRLYNDGINSLAASMIEKVPHRCKFAEYGCEVKDFLCQLKIHEEKCEERTMKIHEEKCEERTIRCPYDFCGAVVQLKKYVEHAFEKKCCLKLGTKISNNFSTGFLQWDGSSKKKGKEFDLDKEINFKIVDTKENYFVFQKYCPKLESLVLAVFMAKDPEEVEKYSAKITIYSKTLKHFKTTFECSVIPIEHFPSEEDFPLIDGCWNVHYSFLRRLFEFIDKGENNNHKWAVTLNWSIEVTTKKN